MFYSMPPYYHPGPVAYVPVYAPYQQPQCCGCSCRSHERFQQRNFPKCQPSFGRDDFDQVLTALVPLALKFLSALEQSQEPTSSSHEKNSSSTEAADFVSVGEKILEKLSTTDGSEDLKPFLEMGKQFLQSLKSSSPEVAAEHPWAGKRCKPSFDRKGKGRPNPGECGPSTCVPPGTHPFAHFQEMMMKKFKEQQKQSSEEQGDERDEIQRAIQESLKDIAKEDVSD